MPVLMASLTCWRRSAAARRDDAPGRRGPEGVDAGAAARGTDGAAAGEAAGVARADRDRVHHRCVRVCVCVCMCWVGGAKQKEVVTRGLRLYEKWSCAVQINLNPHVVLCVDTCMQR